MQPHHPLGRGVHDHLVERPLLAPGQHIFHRAEVGRIDLHRPQLVLRLRFGHADTGQRGVTEHGGWHAVIIDRARIAAKDRIGKGMTLADRHRGQLQTVGHVAHGIDALATGPAIVVDLDRALVVQFDACAVQPQPVDIGLSPGREQDDIGGYRIAILEVDAQRTVIRLFDPFHMRVETEIDALRHRNLKQPVAYLFVIAAQQGGGAIDDRHMAAELVKDAGKFIGDIASADDDDPLWALVEMKHLVRGDAMFRAFDVGHDRPGASRDQYIFRRHFAPAGQLHAVRAGHDRAFGDHLNLVAVECIPVEPLQPVDFAQHIVAQRRPFKAAVGDVPAKAARILQILGEMRAIDQQLLGHAAANDAGAADAKLLGHRDLRPMRCGDTRRAHAARSCTDDEKVEIKLAHAWPPIGCGGYGG